MGNTSTKETPPQQPQSQRHHTNSRTRSTSFGQAGPSSSQSRLDQTIERITTSSRSRHNNSRHNLENALLGFGVVNGRERGDRGEREGEPYRTKEERKLEKEKEKAAEREKERVRSMAEESVDGGYLVTVGVYTGPEDYSLKVVRQLQIERRLAPFWKGLEDHEPSWTDAQFTAVARGLSLPSADAEIPASPTKPTNGDELNKLTVPIPPRSRSHSYTSDTSPSSSSGNFSNLSLPSASAFAGITRPRAKTFGISRGNSSQGTSAVPVETNIGSNTINSRPVEAVLYESAIECPICFLYYPPHLNRTRCCDQLICSECFVQIKRADPHVPEAMSPPGSPNPNAPPAEDAGQLVSEPASCPFCKETEFGIIYAPPPFRRGLVYVNQQHPYAAQLQSPLSYTSVTSSTSSLGPGSPTSVSGFTRRKTSYAATAPEVITTDRIRPDWSTKLSHARNQQARRAAAATALHTAAYLMGSLGGNASSSSNPFSSSRRILRRATHSSQGTANNTGGTTTPSTPTAPGTASGEAESPQEQARRHQDTRRGRMIDLEEMMLMEAIRLSLADEEERKKREEKEAQKKNKKKDKEDKKLAKSSTNGKGKMVDRFTSDDPRGSSTSFQSVPAEAGSSPLKQVSSITSENSLASTSTTPIRIPLNAKSPSSSSSSSFMEGGTSSSPYISSNNIHHTSSNGGGEEEDEGAGNEPMFNFRSLAETLMDDKKDDTATRGKHVEHAEDTAEGESEEIENNEDMGNGMDASIATLKAYDETTVTNLDKGKQADHGVSV